MRKFVCAAVVVVCAVSFAIAEDIRVVITKIDADGKKISYKKAPTEKGGEFGEEMTATLTNSAKIYKGKRNPETKKFEADKESTVALDDAAKMVSKGGKGKKKGAFAVISVEDGKVSQVILFGGGGKKGKKKAD